MDVEPLFEATQEHLLLPRWANTLTSAIRALTKEIHKMSESQQHLDADVQALTAGLDAVEAEIAALKNQPPAAALDFTALDAAVARLQGDAPAPTPPAA
jgi:peptidoglycan hydrolase CwlO-like protein